MAYMTMMQAEAAKAIEAGTARRAGEMRSLLIKTAVIYAAACGGFVLGFFLAAILGIRRNRVVSRDLQTDKPGRRWLKPCDGAERCPQANDVTCEECETVHDIDVKEALVCDSCTKASAYDCEKCLSDKDGTK